MEELVLNGITSEMEWGCKKFQPQDKGGALIWKMPKQTTTIYWDGVTCKQIADLASGGQSFRVKVQAMARRCETVDLAIDRYGKRLDAALILAGKDQLGAKESLNLIKSLLKNPKVAELAEEAGITI